MVDRATLHARAEITESVDAADLESASASSQVPGGQESYDDAVDRPSGEPSGTVDVRQRKARLLAELLELASGLVDAVILELIDEAARRLKS